MYYVYLLKSIKFKRIYIGFSKDLKKRLKTHNSGKVKSTKAYVPWKLTYYEAYRNEKDARRRELNLKEHKPKSELLKHLKESLKMI